MRMDETTLQEPKATVCDGKEWTVVGVTIVSAATLRISVLCDGTAFSSPFRVPWSYGDRLNLSPPSGHEPLTAAEQQNKG